MTDADPIHDSLISAVAPGAAEDETPQFGERVPGFERAIQTAAATLPRRAPARRDAAPPRPVGVRKAIASLALGGLLILFSLAEIRGIVQARIFSVWFAAFPFGLGYSAWKLARKKAERTVQITAIAGMVLTIIGTLMMLGAFF